MAAYTGPQNDASGNAGTDIQTLFDAIESGAKTEAKSGFQKWIGGGFFSGPEESPYHVPSQIFHKGQTAYGKYKIAKQWVEDQAKSGNKNVGAYATQLSDLFDEAKSEGTQDFQRDFLASPEDKAAIQKEQNDQLNVRKQDDINAQAAKDLAARQVTQANQDLDRRNQLLDQLSKPLDPNDPYTKNIMNDVQTRTRQNAAMSGVQGGLAGANMEQSLAGTAAALENNRREQYTSALNGLAMPSDLQAGNFVDQNGMMDRSGLSARADANYNASLNRQQQTGGIITGAATGAGTLIGAYFGQPGLGAAAGQTAGSVGNSLFNPAPNRAKYGGYTAGQ